MDQNDYKIVFGDEMSHEEKDAFWEIIYEKISKAVKKRHLFSIIFHLSENGLQDEDEYSLIIKKDDYGIFLKNYLLWSEEQERYETCAEVKSLINEFEQWEKNIS
jgi:hypothetical protein